MRKSVLFLGCCLLLQGVSLQSAYAGADYEPVKKAKAPRVIKSAHKPQPVFGSKAAPNLAHNPNTLPLTKATSGTHDAIVSAPAQSKPISLENKPKITKKVAEKKKVVDVRRIQNLQKLKLGIKRIAETCLKVLECEMKIAKILHNGFGNAKLSDARLACVTKATNLYVEVLISEREIARLLREISAVEGAAEGRLAAIEKVDGLYARISTLENRISELLKELA
jgi:hypothetical protein